MCYWTVCLLKFIEEGHVFVFWLAAANYCFFLIKIIIIMGQFFFFCLKLLDEKLIKNCDNYR